MPTLPKSPFTDPELADWRRRLVSKARAISDDIDELDREIDALEEVAGGDRTHRADQGSEADTVDKDLELAENERELLGLIRRAIGKIDTGEPVPYGICEYHHEPIARERLEVLPWAPVRTDAAELMEREGLSLDDLAPQSESD